MTAGYKLLHQVGDRDQRSAFLCWAYLSFLLLLTVYQDFPLKNIIGEIGRTPIIMMMPVFLMDELHQLLSTRKVRLDTTMQKALLLFVLYLFFVSIVYVYVQFLQSNFTFGSENILVKAIKGMVYFVLILLYVRHMHKMLTLAVRMGVIYKAFAAVFAFILLYMLAELATIPHAFSFLHANSGPYWRVRLLTSESSTTGTIIIVFSTILLYLSQGIANKKRYMSSALVIAGVILYVAVTSSKGFLIVLFLTVLIMMLRLLDVRRASNIILLVIIGTAGVIGFKALSGDVVSSLQNDMAYYTSLYTRLGTILVAIVTMMNHPFGVGTGAYVIYFNVYMETAIDWMRGMFYTLLHYNDINTSELATYAESDKNLGVKSGLFQWLMEGGVGAIVFFTLLLRWAYRCIRGNLVLLAAYLFLCLSFLFISIDIKYEVWLFFTFLGVLPERKSAGERERERVENSDRVQ
jgi:hypothetical protein